jgi:hypothetical protein
MRALNRSILLAGFLTVAVLASGLIVSLASSPAPLQERGQAPAFPCDVQTTERIVAVGDIHGAYDRFLAILRAADIIDSRNRWSGGKALLVQTGDVLDRGADSRKVIDFLRRLETEAQAAGGRVYALLGNHELMRVIYDWRYVSQGETDAFKTADSAAFRERTLTALIREAERRAKEAGRVFDATPFLEDFREQLPLGALEMRSAFEANGEYGPWVRQRAAVARINGILFLHGGISEAVSSMGCDGINAAVRKDLLSLPVSPEETASLFSSSDASPLWYRGLANEAEDTFAPTLNRILERMRSRAIVIGHTPALPGKITPRFGGRVIQIDTGMLNGEFYPGGVPSALEIRGDKLTAIYLDRRETVAAAGIPKTVPGAAR